MRNLIGLDDALAVKLVLNGLSLVIYAIDHTDDKIYFGYVQDGQQERRRSATIQYDSRGRVYFQCQHRREYLNEFTRI